MVLSFQTFAVQHYNAEDFQMNDPFELSFPNTLLSIIS